MVPCRNVFCQGKLTGFIMRRQVGREGEGCLNRNGYAGRGIEMIEGRLGDFFQVDMVIEAKTGRVGQIFESRISYNKIKE